jgi:hypothetical protein
MRALLTASALALLVLLMAGCSVVPTVRDNTKAIIRSTEQISANSQAVGESTATLASLEPSMTELAELKGPMVALHGPMIDVAELGPDLERVSELEGPLGEMAARVADLHESMGALMELRGSLDRLTALESSMGRLASLEEPMLRLAGLKEPMEQTNRLAEPLRDLGEELDALMVLADRSWLPLAVCGGIFWALLTFGAVWLGVVMGMRSGGKPRIAT